MKNYHINIKNDKDFETRISKFKKTVCILIFPLILITMFLLSCSDHKLESPFDTENTLPSPTNLSITLTSITSCNVSWQDNSTGEQGFKIDRKKDNEDWIIPYQTVGENSETLTETNLNTTSTYQYRVYGFADENTTTIIEGIINMSVPAPENLTYTLENSSPQTTDIHLHWDYLISGIEGFRVKKNDTLLSDIIPAGTTEWSDIGVDIQAIYAYQVLAFYQSYNSELSNQVLIGANCIDIDGNEYEVVQIGDQIWMAENLKVTHYRNGDDIPLVIENNQWSNLSGGAYCYSYAPVDIYGNLYNWFAIDDARELAPEGWHVPTDGEIMELEMYLGMSQSQAYSSGYRGTNEGSKLAGDADLWFSDGLLENDPEFGSSGFDLIPANRRGSDGDFYASGHEGYFWSNTEISMDAVWTRSIDMDNTGVARYQRVKTCGFSVRCVRD
jgi:uncharacterized protein (TIGR02145 family)